jgi:hypothetical protein
MIDVVFAAAAELRDERYVEAGSFGVSGGMWATSVGITLADPAVRVYGRGWWEGYGAWKMPRFRKHPMPLGLCVIVRVCSHDLDRLDPYGDQGIGNGRLVLQQYSEPVAVDYARRFVDQISAGPEGLVSQLQSHLYAWDPDDG